METQLTPTIHHFLQGGGEMGKLTREYDWSSTAAGDPESWPQSLRTTVSIILNSKFPMFLWWGEEMIQFYNDAYRPSLGNDGKHPLALGQKGKECWPEIWDIIYPLITQVQKTGEATWSEDQLIPIYRNGKIEDVYWTFGYSPIIGESGGIEGVLVVCNETTSKVKTMHKLIESEKRFQNLIRDASVGIVVLSGEESRVEIVNQYFGNLINKSVDEITGKQFEDIIPGSIKGLNEVIDNVRISGKPYFSYDEPYLVFDKGEKKEGYLNIIFQPVKEEDGGIKGVMLLCQDVTEEVISRKKLQKSEERVRSLVQSAPFPIGVYIGKEMQIELANQAILDVWGKGNHVIGKLYSEVLPELENQEIFQQLENVYLTGIAFHAYNQRVDLAVNNQIRTYYFNYSFTPLFNNSGEVYGVMNTAADVTDLNLVSKKLEKSEKNLRNTILQAPVAMCIFRGSNHVVELANQRMYELWGRSENELINKPIFEGLPEASKQGFEELLDSVYQTGETVTAQEVPVILPRNEKVQQAYVNVVYEAYREVDGSVSGILAVATDVTDQVIAKKKIEEVVTERTSELALVNYNLKKSNAELAQFAYIASHDLQEPLRKITTYAQMLETNLQHIDDRSKKYLEKINNSSSRMIRLIRDVLTYSELEREKIQSSDVNLNTILQDVLNDYELLIEQTNAEIKADPLPTIEAIPLQMAQLFSNLFSNAIKFRKTDAKPLIRIKSERLKTADISRYKLPEDREYFKIEFIDNGIGFSQEHADQIFNIFQRLHRKSEFEGTGIGLAMCKKIAMNHQGELIAHGNKGMGATFEVILPEKQFHKQ